MLVYDYFETTLLLGFFKILCYFCKQNLVSSPFLLGQVHHCQIPGRQHSPSSQAYSTARPAHTTDRRPAHGNWDSIEDSGRKTLNPSVDASRDSRRPSIRPAPPPSIIHPHTLRTSRSFLLRKKVAKKLRPPLPLPPPTTPSSPPTSLHLRLFPAAAVMYRAALSLASKERQAGSSAAARQVRLNSPAPC
jgi:hypothetical protein